MRRLVWIGAALLIMVAIFGYAMYTMRNIEQVNQRRREKDAGNDVVAQIVATTETTNIWDKLRPTETETGETGTVEITENPNSMHNALTPNATDATMEEITEDVTEFAPTEAMSEEIEHFTIVIDQ